MLSSPVTRQQQDPLAFLATGGEMGERIRALDWSKTPLGPAESWSPALRTLIRLMLANRLPMLLWWGPQYPQVSGGRPRILLADDNADMRQYLRRLLSEHYHVEAVPDGRAALDAAKRSMPDLILSDVMMPRLDGLGLLREIRADQELCTLPVILLTARAGEESRVEGMQAADDDYLVKPFGARELLARVSAHLQMARLRRRAENDARRNNELFRLVHQIGKIGHWEWNSLTDENKLSLCVFSLGEYLVPDSTIVRLHPPVSVALATEWLQKPTACEAMLRRMDKRLSRSLTRLERRSLRTSQQVVANIPEL
jgi:CheY-like chemotaxis protein